LVFIWCNINKSQIDNYNKFDYDNEWIEHRKHIKAERIKYIGKESNNLEDNLIGIEKPDYLEYTKDHEIVNSKNFEQWILSLKPKDVTDKRISHQALYYQKSLIRNRKNSNFKQKVVKILLQLYIQSWTMKIKIKLIEYYFT